MRIFKNWNSNSLNDFCESDITDDSSGVYVNLKANPERDTGYKGHSANRIWSFLYALVKDSLQDHQSWFNCKECKILYRILSGLHASISIHIADQYFNSETKFWESNYDIFYTRVYSHKDRLENFYFLYALVLRSILKIDKILLNMNFTCGSDSLNKRFNVRQN